MSGRRSVRATLIVTTVVTLLTLLALTPQASATPLAEKKARAAEIAKQAAALDGKLEVVIEQYNAASDKLASVKAAIRGNERNIKIARYNLMVAKATLRDRVVLLYKERAIDMLDVLLATRSFDDLLSQLHLLNKLGLSDARVVTSVGTYENEIVARRATLAQQRSEAANLYADVSAKKRKIEAALATREHLLKGVKAEIRRMEDAAAKKSRAQAPPVPVGTGANAGPGHPEVLAVAALALGKPYAFGAAGPDAFDCSGLTMWAFQKIGISLPHNAAGQSAYGALVGRDQLAPGDLVFFGSPIHHVGIYAGNGQMIHAPQTGYVVCYASVDSLGDFVFGKRL